MINWGSNSALAGFQNALALGADIGGAIKQNREDSALAAFMAASNKPAGGPTGALGTPTMPTQWGGNGGGIVPTETQKTESQAAYERLAKINPRLALQAQDRVAGQEAARAKLMQEQRAADLRTKAAQGDPAALQELVGIDFEGWSKLDANKRRLIEDQTKYTGQAALRISQIKDPREQAAAWDQAVDQGVQAGYAGMADYRGKFSTQALNAAIDNAGLVDKFIELAQPKYIVRPQDSDLINVRDPEAIKAAGVGAPTQVAAPASKADYDALPPGAQYRAPDGSIKRKGGGVSNGTGGF